MKDYKLTKKQKEFFIYLKKYLTDMKEGYGGDYFMFSVKNEKCDTIDCCVEHLLTILKAINRKGVYDDWDRTVLTKLRGKFIQRTEDMRRIEVGDIVKVLSVERTFSNFDYLDKQMYGVGDEFRVYAVKSSHITKRRHLVEDEQGYSYSTEDLIKI